MVIRVDSSIPLEPQTTMVSGVTDGAASIMTSRRTWDGVTQMSRSRPEAAVCREGVTRSRSGSLTPGR